MKKYLFLVFLIVNTAAFGMEAPAIMVQHIDSVQQAHQMNESQKNLVIYSRNELYFEQDEAISLIDALITGELETEPENFKMSFKHYKDCSFVYSIPFFIGRSKLIELMNESLKMQSKNFSFDFFIGAMTVLPMPFNLRLHFLKRSFFQSALLDVQKYRLAHFVHNQLFLSTCLPYVLGTGEIVAIRETSPQISEEITKVMNIFRTSPTTFLDVSKRLEELLGALVEESVPEEYKSDEILQSITGMLWALKKRNTKALNENFAGLDKLFKINPAGMPKSLLDKLNKTEACIHNLPLAFICRFKTRINAYKNSLQRDSSDSQHILDFMMNLRKHLRNNLIFTPEFHAVFWASFTDLLNQKISSQEDLDLLINSDQSVSASTKKE